MFINLEKIKIVPDACIAKQNPTNLPPNPAKTNMLKKGKKYVIMVRSHPLSVRVADFFYI